MIRGKALIPTAQLNIALEQTKRPQPLKHPRNRTAFTDICPEAKAAIEFVQPAHRYLCPIGH